MWKLFLPAKVPNEGARRLAAWILASPPHEVKRRFARIGLDFGKAARMIEGELLPGADDRFAIRGITDFVFVRDWSLPAEGRWGDPVPCRLMGRAA